MATAEAIRIEPPPEAEKKQVSQLYRMLIHDGTAVLAGPGPEKISLPRSVYDVLLKVVTHMQEGKAIAVFPLMEELSTQAAASMLGVSRQFLVTQLEAGKIPFHRAGAHRRVYMKDLMDFKKQRQETRRSSIERMAKKAQELGIYDKFIPPEDDK